MLCRICGRNLDAHFFKRNSKTTRRYTYDCKFCIEKEPNPSRRDVKARQINKIKVVQAFADVCSLCGESWHPWQYDLHHKNTSEKKKSASLLARPWEEIINELPKLALLCRNCHADIHWNPALRKHLGLDLSEFN